MNVDKQKTRWLADVFLTVGFLGAMWLDLTGLEIHQWLGMAVAAVAAWHLFNHWQWVKAVTCGFCGWPKGNARRLCVVDLLLLVAFFGISVTGLVMSSWLNLPLANYLVWRDVHVWVSILTLLVLVLKIGMHWRWVINTTERLLFARRAQPVTVAVGAGSRRLTRRQFGQLMLPLSGMALYSIYNVLSPTFAAFPTGAVAQAPVGSAPAAGTPVASPTFAGGGAAEATVAPATAMPATATPAPTAAQLASVSTRGGKGRGAVRKAAAVQSPANGAGAQTWDVSAAATPGPISVTQPNPEPPAPSAPPVMAPPVTAPPMSAAAPAPACQPVCPVGCSASSPNRCRRYTDSNGNGFCDLGECIA